MGAAESNPEPPRSPSEEMKRELERRERELMREMARRAEEMVGHCERKSVPAVLGLLQIHSDVSPVNHFSDPWNSFEELRINLEKDEKAEEMCGRQWMTVKMGAAESHPQPPKSLYEERKRELQRRKEEMDRRYGLYRREEEMDRNEKRKKKFQIIKEVRARQARKGLPASVVPSQIHSDQSSKDDFSKPRISFKEPRDLATGKMQQCNSDDLGLSQPSVKMGATESHPEQDPRYLEMQRELQRINEELDRRERELRREMDRREQEIDRRERELKRKEEEIDRRESELMREMARREEEMVGHCERQSVPAVLGLSRIHSDGTQLTNQSPEYDFSEPLISFEELRINLEKDEEAEEMCDRQWMTEERTKFSGQLERRNKLLEEASRRHLGLMELVRREKEMVAHQEGDELSASAEDRPGMSSEWMKRKGLVLKKQQESERHPELEEERTKFSGPLETTNKLLEEARRTHLHRRHLGLMELDRREKEMERKENELERRAMELDEREEEMDRRERELERRAMELVRREKEMDEHQEGDELSASAEDRPGMSSDESKKMPTEELKPVRRNSKELDPPSMSESGDKPSSSP